LPIYEYSCPKCGVFEHIQRVTDPTLETCPHCGQKVKKLIGRNVGIMFKTSGFYSTDNRSESYKQKEKENDSPASSVSGLNKTGAGDSGSSDGTSSAKKDTPI